MDAINFPLLNASLNFLAGVLLTLGYVAIRRRRELLHKRLMLTAFGVSVVFLISYLTYHYMVGHTVFAGPTYAKAIYYPLLLTHVLLAMAVPPLAIITIYLGLKDRRAAHRRIAKITFPIWLYVSVTGVIIYVMLYQLFPTPPGAV